LLLHGFPQTAWEWLRVMDLLGDSFAVFAPDGRGFGSSDKPRIRVTLDLLARDAIDLMDALGLERATLVGHDFGGMIATAAALQYPERFHRVAILDSTATVWMPWASHGYWFKVEGLAEAFFAEHYRAFLHSVFLGAAPGFPAMPTGPFPPGRRGKPSTWCDAESLAHYVGCYADPDSQWAAISYYRDALPFHRIGESGGFELIQPKEIERMWGHPGGYTAHPSFGEFHSYAPERAHQRFDGPTLYLYTRALNPAAFESKERPKTLPVTGNPAAQAFVDHFPALRALPVDGSHFIPEEQPKLVADLLRDFTTRG
jgi:pimeloyl-ACP methyl ester carboxylesterase